MNWIYQKIDELGSNARAGLAKIFREAKIDVQVTGDGSLFLTHFQKKKVRNATDAATSDQELLHKYHMGLIALHQIFFLPSKMGAISVVHTDKDVTHLLDASRSLAESGILSYKDA